MWARIFAFTLVDANGTSRGRMFSQSRCGTPFEEQSLTEIVKRFSQKRNQCLLRNAISPHQGRCGSSISKSGKPPAGFGGFAVS